MNERPLPPAKWAKELVVRRVIHVIDMVRRRIGRPVVLLATGDAPPAKLAEVDDRLRFLLAHIERPLEIRRVTSASPLDYVRSIGVAAADRAGLSPLARRRFRWASDLDYETNPRDAWDLIDLGSAISGKPDREDLAVAQQRLVDHVHRLSAGEPKPAYLFGTGPSLRLARERSFGDGTAVVCNTIVRDADLWHHLAPAFLAAGDAIYHFGHTPHARAFRDDALRRLKESDGRTLFVYPFQFDVIVRAEFKDVQSMLVPIPRGEYTDPVVDLTRRFSIPSLGNVLGDLLLPLGCTLSRDIRLWGFDGRAPRDTGFWSNSDRQSYPELMQSMRDAHPAFFADAVPEGKESRYVELVHGDRLDDRLTDAERRGYRFRMLHPSWTPTFQKRYHEPIVES